MKNKATLIDNECLAESSRWHVDMMDWTYCDVCLCWVETPRTSNVLSIDMIIVILWGRQQIVRGSSLLHRVISSWCRHTARPDRSSCCCIVVSPPPSNHRYDQLYTVRIVWPPFSQPTWLWTWSVFCCATLVVLPIEQH